MAFSKIGLVAAGLMVVLASGCTSTRVSSMNTQPAPLQPAPSGQVSTSALPPPATPGPADSSSFPDAPGASTDVASIAPADAAAGAPDITTASVAGVWSASVSGQSCRVATPQTKFGAGYRAGPLRCPPPVDGVKSWNVSGKQLSLYDESGGVVARLYSAGPEKFNGQTSSGLPISLFR